MKKISLIVFYFVVLSIFADVSMQYELSKPEIEAGKIKLKDCQTTQSPFVPSIAVKPIRILLPDNQKAVDVKIIYDNWNTMQDVALAPVKPSGILSKLPKNMETKSDVWEKSKFFPNRITSEFRNQYKRGYCVVFTTAFPTRYNPKTKELQYAGSVQVEVKTVFEQRNIYSHPLIESDLKKLVDNPEMLRTNARQSNVEYLVITDGEFVSEFETFSDFNLRRGMKTEVVSLQTIASVQAGIDLQEKIRNYIIEKVESDNIVYVLLAGDTDTIPHRGFRSEIYDYGTDYYDETDIPADLYYSCLDGTWKNENAQYYGEPGSEDLLWDVYTARIPFNDVVELQNIMQKIISYNDNPVIGSSNNAMLVGEFLWGSYMGDNFVDTYGKFYLDQLIGMNEENNYTTNGLDENWQIETLYEYDENWDADALMNYINDFAPSMIYHLGHSNNTYNMKLFSASVTSENFTNNGIDENYFLLYSQGCYSGAFDNINSNGFEVDDCIGERFLSIQNGAVAYIGNSRYGLGSPYNTDGSGQRFQRYFLDAMFNENITSLERMNAYSKEINANFILEQDITIEPYYGQCRWIAYCLNVLGDPALSFYKNTPQNLSVDIDEVVEQSFVIHTEPFAGICIVNAQNEVLEHGFADENGDFNVDSYEYMEFIYEANSWGTVYIKADGFLPYSQDICTVGIAPENEKMVWRVFPNPALKQAGFHFQASNFVENATLLIYDIKGRKVIEKAVKNTRSVNLDKEVDRLGAGVYFINFKTPKSNEVKKFVKMK